MRTGSRLSPRRWAESRSYTFIIPSSKALISWLMYQPWNAGRAP